MIRMIFMVFCLVALNACDSNPVVHGEQNIEGAGPVFLVIRVSGPEGVKGVVGPHKMVSFPLKLEIQGPPRASVQIATQVNSVPSEACSLEAFSATLILNADGYASEDRKLVYGAVNGCSIVFDVTREIEQNVKTPQSPYGMTPSNVPTPKTDVARVTFSLSSK